MKKTHGFKVSYQDLEYHCLFTKGDWNILMSDSLSFSPSHFRRLIGLDALGSTVGVSYECVVHRTKNYFSFQMKGVLKKFKTEKHLLEANYKLLKVGEPKTPLSSQSIIYRGLHCVAYGTVGSCSLTMYDSPRQKRIVGLIDLRDSKEFIGDDSQTLKIRKQTRGSSIKSELDSLLEFLDPIPQDAVLCITLAT